MMHRRLMRSSLLQSARRLMPCQCRCLIVESSSPDLPLTQTRRPNGKMRLDEHCVSMYPMHSRKTLQSWIAQGKVLVNGQGVIKAGHQIKASDQVLLIAEELKYVSRAGFKLEAALTHFNINVEGKIALDSGQSTGGFSDCLLQNNIKHIYGVDVGYGQLHQKVRSDSRVTVIERTNLRTLAPLALPEKVDIACLDLSFISVLKCLPAVISSALKPDEGAEIVILIKPQFEAGRQGVERGGIVKDPAVHQAVLQKVIEGCMTHGFRCMGTCESPIRGDKGGNLEFLGYFIRDKSIAVTFDRSGKLEEEDEEEENIEALPSP